MDTRQDIRGGCVFRSFSILERACGPEYPSHACCWIHWSMVKKIQKWERATLINWIRWFWRQWVVLHWSSRIYNLKLHVQSLPPPDYCNWGWILLKDYWTQSSFQFLQQRADIFLSIFNTLIKIFDKQYIWCQCSMGLALWWDCATYRVFWRKTTISTRINILVI